MLIIKIKQVEAALKDGRLDEVFLLLQTAEIRDHRRCQELMGLAARSLVVRGRNHLQAGRANQALSDCDKADKLAGNLEEVAQLRAAVSESLRQEHDGNRRRGQVLAQARRHIDEGQLSAGEGLLEELGDSGGADELRDQAAERRTATAAALREIEQAIADEDWNRAVEQLLQAKQYHQSNEQLIQLNRQVTAALTAKVQAQIETGRLDRAAALLEGLQALSGQTIRADEFGCVIDNCRLAYKLLQKGQVRQGLNVLRQLEAVAGKTKWLATAIGTVEKVAESVETLRAGPLGLLAVNRDGAEERGCSEDETAVDDKGGPAIITRPRTGAARVGDVMPMRFVVQVDGVGSFMVLRQTSVTVGPISAAQNYDLALIAEPNLPAATIERTDEDYFVRAEHPISVNDNAVTDKLLIDGDLIVLSHRCRVRFRRPNAASTSALLSLNGTRVGRADVREVILLDREIVIAAAPSSHIRCDKLDETVVLFLQGGRLQCRSNQPMMINDQRLERPTGLRLGEPVRIGELSLVVTDV